MPTLLEAIDNKYGSIPEDFFFELPVEIFVPKKNPRHLIPTLLVLNGCDIDSAGDEDELQTKCNGVVELDLAQNKLETWTEVFKILKQVPRVTFVNLSFNRLEEHLFSASECRLRHLRNLVLNATRIPWESVRALLDLLPCLEELHLCRNEYDSVELDPESAKPGVSIVHLSGNPVSSWAEVSKLGRVFPRLEALVLAECPLATLEVAGQSAAEQESCPRESFSESDVSLDSPHDAFRRLKVLNLNHTLLGSWREVEKLARFPALRSLRLQGCPLFESAQGYTAHERRQLVIARLPEVVKLNGGDTIGHEEREDAERAFIRYYLDTPEEDRPERYDEVIAIHGRLDPLVNVDLRPEKRVKVSFRLGEKTEVRLISVYQTVSELKTKLEAFSGLPASRMRFYYADQDMKGLVGPEEMKFPHKQLYSYNIASGDEIFIDEKL